MSARTDLDFNVFSSLAGSAGRGFRGGLDCLGCQGLACSVVLVGISGLGVSIAAVLRAASSCGSRPEVAVGFALDAKAPKLPNLPAPLAKPPGNDGLESSLRPLEVEKGLAVSNCAFHSDATALGNLALLIAILRGVSTIDRPCRHAVHTNGRRCYIVSLRCINVVMLLACHACVLSISQMTQMTQIGCVVGPGRCAELNASVASHGS